MSNATFITPPAGLYQILRQQSAWVILICVLIFTAYRDMSLLLGYPVAVGVDGYYYVLQLDSLLKSGHLYFQTKTPLILYTMYPVARLVGSSVLAIKIVSVGLHVLLCLGLFAIVFTLTRKHWLGYLSVIIASISVLHVYLIGEFINSLGCLTFLIWCLFSALKAMQTRRRSWVLIAVGCLLAALFSHKIALLIIPLAISSLLLFSFFAHKQTLRNRSAICIVAIILWILPSLLLIQPLVYLPVWLTQQLSTTPRIPLNSAFMADGSLLIFASLLMLFVVAKNVAHVQKNLALVVFGSIAVLSLLVTMNPFLNPTQGWVGLAGRIKGLMYIQSAILVPGIIWLYSSHFRKASFYVGAITIPLLWLTANSALPIGLTSEYLQRRKNLVERLPQLQVEWGNRPLVIAPHGDEFLITSITRIPSQQHWPNDQYDKIYWLLNDVPESKSLRIVSSGHEGSYVVLMENEELYQSMLSWTEVERMQFLSSNPHLKTATAFPARLAYSGNR